ncbi:hypothetical protein H2O64_18830 [Kordia sp. YSTF-M3]|uniref:Alpha/beta hydrolase n=1 Tax=Kordia aestuariivivens TaxID=2759037 RepID=A0ABR7QDU6_9FLAO|nr:hypothetical protein [Kordia aestuariivivens]MBC8756736.1 hypothetical protein [Kordia aestuariivivens]
MKKKLLYVFLIFALLIGIAGYILTIHVLPYAIVQPQKINLALTPQKLGLQGEKLTVNVEDSISLKGYYIQSNTSETKGIIILIHGVGGCK